MPFDVPSRLPPRPERSGDAVAWVLRQPGVKAATAELVTEAAERLGLRSPVDGQGFQRIVNDRLFQQRIEAVVTATLLS
jgi:hypothetical protein